MTYAMIDVYCASYPCPPAAVTLDIDDTLDVVHGHRQLSLFNAHYDERGFLPIHVYDIATSRPVAILLRPGKVGDSYDNALAETIIDLFKAEVIHRRGPSPNAEAVEFATLPALSSPPPPESIIGR